MGQFGHPPRVGGGGGAGAEGVVEGTTYQDLVDPNRNLMRESRDKNNFKSMSRHMYGDTHIFGGVLKRFFVCGEGGAYVLTFCTREPLEHQNVMHESRDNNI